MAPQYINLKQQFGRRYRVAYEESYQAAYGSGARTEDPWLMVILCRYGHIYYPTKHSGALAVASRPARA